MGNVILEEIERFRMYEETLDFPDFTEYIAISLLFSVKL